MLKLSKVCLGFVLLLAVFVVAPSVNALQCDYNANPFIVDLSRPNAVCTVTNLTNDKCYTFLSDPVNDSEIWGGMPPRENVIGVGSVDYYLSQDHIVQVEFSRYRLFDGEPVTFNVVCGTEETSFNITPTFVDAEIVGELSLWAIGNMAFIFLAVVILIIFLILLKLAVSRK